MTRLDPEARRRSPWRFAGLAWIMAVLAIPAVGAATELEDKVEQIVSREIRSALPEDGVSGVAVAVRSGERTLFFNYGYADSAQRRPVNPDTLFNLASIGKVFDTTLLALAIGQGQIGFDNPVVEFVPELRDGGDIRRVTLGQLASHTSGLVLPQDHPPWPEEGYTLPEFLRTLKAWKVVPAHEPGKQPIYSHAGFILLHLAMERRFGGTYAGLMDERVLRPLGLASTSIPMGPDDPRGSLDPALRARAIQGYDEDGTPIGASGNVQGYYLWPGTAQMFSSARDLAVFIAANLSELSGQDALQEAMQWTHRGVIRRGRRSMQALAWEILREDGEAIIEKKGGLNNNLIYIGMIERAKLGIAILWNRGNQDAVEAGRRILLKLARRKPPE